MYPRGQSSCVHTRHKKQGFSADCTRTIILLIHIIIMICLDVINNVFVWKSIVLDTRSAMTHACPLERIKKLN